ncbi:MAG TPA: YihY/virulence factor BrkB family protein [Longimicrobiales bacterium]
MSDYARAVYAKAAADNIFFMAGAIAFNVLVAFAPLVLAALGIAGTILRLQHTDPTEPLLGYIFGSLPPVSEEFEAAVRGILRQLVAQSTGFLSIGTLFLVWLSTRLVGTLRTVLREVFDIQQGRGIVAGKLFDIKMVLAAGTLLALNVGLTVSLEVIARFGLGALGFERNELLPLQYLYGRMVAFVSIWVMFLLMYRYLPPRKIHWSTAIVAATFAGALFELLKLAFGWYVTNIADYRTAYGNLATLIVLILWIYYSAAVFILGGEVGQIFAMRRVRRHQRERLR